MLRPGLLLAAIATALVCALASDLAHGRTAEAAAGPEAAAGHNITLRGKFPEAGWRKALSRKLVPTRLTRFTLCAVWDQPAAKPFNCIGVAGNRLPVGTELRLEQKPAGKGLKLRDSPGWGMIGLSPTPVVRAPLSNAVTGNKLGTVRFRVTLRKRGSGQIVYRSNPLVLRWHR